MGKAFYCLIRLSFVLCSLSAKAIESTLPVLGDPALLMDNETWLKDQNKFREVGSETRAYLDLVTILYDWDNGRPWGQQYFPEANKRLNRIREAICSDLPELRVCQRPIILSGKADVALLEDSLFDGNAISALEARFKVKISPWALPLREQPFSLIAATSARNEKLSVGKWGLGSKEISVTYYDNQVLADAPNYRAGFDSKDVNAIVGVRSGGFNINNRQLQQRATDFATEWKHAVETKRSTSQEHVIVDANEIQMRRLYAENIETFSELYPELFSKIASLPEIRARFEQERREGKYPEEVYQHVSYCLMLDLVQVQSAHLSLSDDSDSNRGARIRVLESLTTVQRYSKSSKMFALEMMLLSQPLNSRGFVLDETTDGSIALTYIAENLKALLGMENYDGKALFPKIGKGLLSAQLIDVELLKDQAPDVVAALKGRAFTELSTPEQLEILRLYLRPPFGKVRSLAAARMGALLFSTSTEAELHDLADSLIARP